jgi:hypothetical protein
MKRVVLFLAITGCIISGCKKGGSGGNNTPAEENLVVELNPANGSVQVPSIGPFSLKVTVTSAMPPNGVKVEVTARKDDGSGSAAYFSSSSNTSASVSNFNITGTPANVQCLVEIKVTSLTKPSNLWSGSYRYSAK